MKSISKRKVIVTAAILAILLLASILIINRKEINGRLAVRSLNSQLNGVTNCGSETLSRLTSDTQDHNTCFEDAFKQCQPSYLTSNIAGFASNLVIVGKDNAGYCVGGSYYSKAPFMDGDHLGTGYYCRLDVSKKNFDTAFMDALDSSTINDGIINQPDDVCKFPTDVRM